MGTQLHLGTDVIFESYLCILLLDALAVYEAGDPVVLSVLVADPDVEDETMTLLDWEGSISPSRLVKVPSDYCPGNSAASAP